MNIKLTVFFDDPFWTGVFERVDDNLLQTSRVVFGAEPKDYEVYCFILENYYSLKYGETVKSKKEISPIINPKRLQREIQKQMTEKGIGTKAQRAIQESLNAKKVEFKKIRKEEREQQEELKFKWKQQKKKEKKKGH